MNSLYQTRVKAGNATQTENASKTEPAKLLAVFVVDTDEKELLRSLKR